MNGQETCKPEAPALGIEIENAWVKCVAIVPGGPRARGYPLPFHAGSDRSDDVAEGLAAALAAFERETGIRPASCRTAVAASSHFAYPTFRQAHEQLVALVSRHLPRARLAASDGLHSLSEARGAAGTLRFVLSRTLGIRALARACSQAPLAVDCGTTSTEAVWLTPGPIANPDADSAERLRDGRLTWIGAIETPLDFVADRAAGWPLVPRVARMGAVTALCARNPTMVDTVAARREVAQAVGLDAEILGDRVMAVAEEVLQAAIGKLAAALGQVLGSREALAEVAVMGVGATLLARPALAACGIRRVVDVEEAAGVPPNFGAALGLALAARSGISLARISDPSPAPLP